MKTIKVYTPSELKRKNPDAFEHALDKFRASDDMIPWCDEIIDSLKAIFKASGIRLQDYSLDGNYPSSSNVRFEMDDSVRELSGNRALAWIENNLLADLRIPFRGAKRWELSQYGQYYRAGMIKPCPFTGVCFDDDYLNSLQKSIKDGESLGDAYQNLAYVAGKLMESEIEYQNSEENFLEQDYLFTVDGRRV